MSAKRFPGNRPSPANQADRPTRGRGVIKLSVSIVTYQQARYVREAVESVLPGGRTGASIGRTNALSVDDHSLW